VLDITLRLFVARRPSLERIGALIQTIQSCALKEYKPQVTPLSYRLRDFRVVLKVLSSRSAKSKAPTTPPTQKQHYQDNMNKRHRESDALQQDAGFLKSGDRPVREDGEVLEFEDEFEDEFESDDEIFEAGVDGRPDAEREAEEQGGKMSINCYMYNTEHIQKQWI